MNGTGVAIWDRHPRKLQIRMIFTLLRRVPETLLHRLQYEFRKIVPPRAAPARAAEKKAIDVDASALPASPIKIPETSSVDAEQSQLLASLEAKTGQSIEMTQRAAFLDLHRSPESLYDHANPINRCAG